jgi:hypothetical protein
MDRESAFGYVHTTHRHSNPAKTMSAYDPNSDENWFKEYCVGQMTGGGWGIYGQMGNQEYRAEQRRQEKQRRQFQSRKTPEPPRLKPSPSAAEAFSTSQSASREKSWSTFFAMLGFLAGAVALYDPVDPSWGLPLFAGLVSGYIAGRFYKALLLIGAVLLYYGAA